MEKKMMNGVARIWGMITLCSCMVQLCMGDVYTVGDSAGWTIMNHVDYKSWAASKTFKVGVIVVFNYNSKFHNVMQVTHAEYKSCNASTPIKTYATGNDSIAITTQGHHFFTCGIPGHCQAGQKVDINVIRESLKAPSPSTSSSPPAVAAGLVPAPSPSETANAAQVSSRFIGSLGMTMAVIAAFV